MQIQRDFWCHLEVFSFCIVLSPWEAGWMNHVKPGIHGSWVHLYTTSRMWSYILKWCIFEVLLLLLALYNLSSLDENAIILTVTWECYERSVAKYLEMIEIHLQEHFYRWSASQSHQIISNRLNSRNFVFYNKMYC